MLQKVYNWYSKGSVQKALVEVGENREVISVFKDGSFGKRPDILQYPADILQSVSSGAVAFHGSVERWKQPMKLVPGMTKSDLDSLRGGWDILIDPDVKDFGIAKIVTKQILEALKDHGVKNYSVKFTGGKGFHIGVSFESLPEKINFQPVSILYPDLLRKLIEYLKSYIREQFREKLLVLDSPYNLANRAEKTLNSIMDKEDIDPFKIVSMDVFSSRHLFRLPYSMHESTLLVSLPVKPENIDRFEKESAEPDKAKVEEKFLVPKTKGDGELLLVEAMDWASKYKEEVKALPKFKPTKITYIPERYFPPCIKDHLLKGMADGRKRGLFILINFLRNAAWKADEIEKRVVEWNEKNYPPLRTNYVRSQLRWHFRQSNRTLLPPNCGNEVFYKSIGLDVDCEKLHQQGIKNPVTYAVRQISRPARKK